MKRISILLIFVLSTCVLTAQETKTVDLKVQSSFLQFEGKTAPLRDLVKQAANSPEQLAEYKRKFKLVPNFIGRPHRSERKEPTNPGLPNGPDALYLESLQKSGAMITLEPEVNIAGLPSVANPPDPSGDIGKDHYLQAVNATSYRVYNKDGSGAGPSINANTLWNSVGFSSAGDPIILYDQEAERWIITEFPPDNFLLMAVSETSDPFGSYYAYSFSTPTFPDYPKWSIWPNAYVITTNEFTGGLATYFLDRQAILDGDENPALQRTTVPDLANAFEVATPVDWSGSIAPLAPNNPMIMQLHEDNWNGVNEDGVELWTFDIDWDNSDNTEGLSVFIPTSSFDSYPCSAGGAGFACIPQLGNSTGIDGLPGVIMNRIHYRNFGTHESIVLNFIVDATGSNHSGIRWMELRRQYDTGWELYQEGTYSPDTETHRFMGAISMDGAGNIGLAYSVSSNSIYPGLRFTGRKSTDPLGEMTVDEYTIIDGLSDAGNAGRYGDYADMSVDPADELTFWFTGQYMRTVGRATRICAFRFERDSIDIGTTAVITPIESDALGESEMVSVEVKNFGLSPQFEYQVGYKINGGSTVIETATSPIGTDETYVHTFEEPVNLNEIGAYDFTVFTSLDGDNVLFNDSTRQTIWKLPKVDCGITSISGLDGVICSEVISANVEIENFGTETLTLALIDVTVNGVSYTTFDWVGELATGESEIFEVILDAGLVDNVNFVEVHTSFPNGTADEVPENDARSRNFIVAFNSSTLLVSIETDAHPNETTWAISDDEGNVLYEGGPYTGQETTYDTEICVGEFTCYDFAIFDSAGDGLNWFATNGSYSIVHIESGETLTSIDNIDFGFEENNAFCGSPGCILDLEVNVVQATEGVDDGAIVMIAMSGNGPYQFSIDGGENFQEQGFFTSLPPGVYNISVVDVNGCAVETSVSVPSCNLMLEVEIQNATSGGAADGEVIVDIDNATQPISFSLDDGQTTQNSNVFDGLFAGNYDLVVIDGNGCMIELDVQVQIGVGIESEYLLRKGIEVLPNPNNGLFIMNVYGLNAKDLYLGMQVFDFEGKLMKTGSLVRYDQVYTAQISLAGYPDGIYFIRFLTDELDRAVRIVKQ